MTTKLDKTNPNTSIGFSPDIVNNQFASILTPKNIIFMDKMLASNTSEEELKRQQEQMISNCKEAGFETTKMLKTPVEFVKSLKKSVLTFVKNGDTYEYYFVIPNFTDEKGVSVTSVIGILLQDIISSIEGADFNQINGGNKNKINQTGGSNHKKYYQNVQIEVDGESGYTVIEKKLYIKKLEDIEIQKMGKTENGYQLHYTYKYDICKDGKKSINRNPDNFFTKADTTKFRKTLYTRELFRFLLIVFLLYVLFTNSVSDITNGNNNLVSEKFPGSSYINSLTKPFHANEEYQDINASLKKFSMDSNLNQKQWFKDNGIDIATKTGYDDITFYIALIKKSGYANLHNLFSSLVAVAATASSKSKIMCIFIASCLCSLFTEIYDFMKTGFFQSKLGSGQLPIISKEMYNKINSILSTIIYIMAMASNSSAVAFIGRGALLAIEKYDAANDVKNSVVASDTKGVSSGFKKLLPADATSYLTGSIQYDKDIDLSEAFNETIYLKDQDKTNEHLTADEILILINEYIDDYRLSKQNKTRFESEKYPNYFVNLNNLINEEFYDDHLCDPVVEPKKGGNKMRKTRRKPRSNRRRRASRNKK